MEQIQLPNIVEIWNQGKKWWLVQTVLLIKKFIYKTVLNNLIFSAIFLYYLKTKPFKFRTDPCHLNKEHVRFLSLHCMYWDSWLYRSEKIQSDYGLQTCLKLPESHF